MKIVLLSAAICLFEIVLTRDACAQDSTTSIASNSRDAEIEAIRKQSEAFVSNFNKQDAKAVAALWTATGEYIDETGQSFIGREAVESGYEGFFAENPEAKMQLQIDSIRILSENTAVEDGRAVLVSTGVVAPAVSHYNVTHIKQNGKWLMALVRDTVVETPVAVRHAADLEWLVGDWTAEEHGVTFESTIQWVVDDKFLERSYTTTHLDGSKSSGKQLIGWNPQQGSVQSWDFSADGGHAIGIWTPTENGWQAEVHGITGDGIPTTAVNVLNRLDDNAYAWQSVLRSLGDVAIPDTGEVIIKRISKP